MKFRRLGTFSIRALLAVTMLVAVCVAIPYSNATKQCQGRQWVEAQRGHVSFKYQYDYDASRFKIPHVPGFMISCLGVDVFNPAHGVIFDCDTIEDLAPITDLKSLKSIFVNIDMVEGLDFSPLKELPNLEEIHFTEWSTITEKQFRDLKNMLPGVSVTTYGRGKP